LGGVVTHTYIHTYIHTEFGHAALVYAWCSIPNLLCRFWYTVTSIFKI